MAINDPLKGSSGNDPAWPSRHGTVVAPSNTVDFAQVALRLYVGVSGDIVVRLAGDLEPVTLKAVPVGMLTGLQIARVLSTGTTATDMVAFWG